jgi:hypothetical protein
LEPDFSDGGLAASGGTNLSGTNFVVTNTVPSFNTVTTNVVGGVTNFTTNTTLIPTYYQAETYSN